MKRVSSNDIAKKAGVSRSTVSRVINGYDNVPKETYDRVMKVIQEMHYYPQLSGRQLTGKGSNTLGIFWIGKSGISRYDLFRQIFISMIDTAAERDYLTLSCIIDNLAEQKNVDKVRRIFSEGRIDAGIFVGVSNTEPLMDELPEKGFLIGIHDYYNDMDAQPLKLSVNYDPDSGERLIDYLYSIGHRRIAIVDGDMTRRSCIDRHESMLRGMLKHKLPLQNKWLTYGGFQPDTAYPAAKRMLEDCMDDLPTAICANNDSSALGVYRACQELGLRIPEDISVIGTDGDPEGQAVLPPLSTYAIDTRNMYNSLVTRVIDTIEGKENVPQTEFFKGNLLLRGSCSAPRSN